MAGAVMEAARDPAANPPEAGSRETPSEVLEFELQLEQLETGTRPCLSLDELGREVRRCRKMAAEAAERVGVQVAAMGTSPMAVEPSVTGLSRYRQMAAEFGMTAQEQLTCGCHVHVQVSSDDEGIAILDRIRPWLAPLLALSANSPFCQGRDSGYASFRYQAWGRWPSSGPTDLFGSAAAYHGLVQAMVDTGTVLDQGMIYFDARLSRHYPTIEVRVADVCLYPDDAVLIAALVRSLAETAARAWRAGEPASPVRTELLRLAAWRASRSGLGGKLADPVANQPAAARAVVRQLLDHVRPALTDAGEFTVVRDLLEELLARGNGARLQRQAYQRAGQLGDVVRDASTRTSPANRRMLRNRLAGQLQLMPVLRAVARPMLASIFAVQGYDTLRHPERVSPLAEPVAQRVSERVPGLPDKTEQLVRINGGVQLAAGSLLALGRLPRLSALAIAATLVPTTLAGHRFWEAQDKQERAQQRIHFLKNVAILGGLLITAADTAGRPSLAWRGRHAARSARHDVTLAARTARMSGKAGARAGRLASRLPVG